MREERKEHGSKGHTKRFGKNKSKQCTGRFCTDESNLRCIAMKDEFNRDNIPETLNMEQFHKLCHISKKTARYLLRSGKVPCTYSGK